MRARPLFTLLIVAAFVIGMPAIAYTGVVATTAIGNHLATDHKRHLANALQPALGHGRGASPGVSGSPGPSGAPGQPGDPGPGGSGESGGPCQVDAMLVPSCGVLWGVAAGAFTGTPADVALRNWEATSGRTADVFHVYHRGDELFPTASEIAAANEPGHSRLLLINWKVAWGTTWAKVAAGAQDARIDREAQYIKTHFTQKFFLAIHHEPENDVIETAGSGMTAKDYAQMFRHTVLRLRADGVTNAVFVLAYMGYEGWCEKPWFGDLWPGSDVVDWIGYDPYETAKPGAYAYGDFAKLVNGTHKPAIWPGFYTWATTTHPGIPVMLAEWGVFEFPSDPSQKAWIDSTVASEIGEFPQLKGIVYFDSPNAPKGDTRINSTPTALASFRALAAQPIFDVNVAPGNAGLS